MGQSLDKPIEVKEQEHDEKYGLTYALSAMQGWRLEMEDAHTIAKSIEGYEGVSFFAVYDGHGGMTVSKRSSTDLLGFILNTDQFKSGDKNKAELWSESLYRGMLGFDQQMREQDPRLNSLEDHSGSTAITAFVTATHIIFGNCGDSRGVLAREGKPFFATLDHKPTDPGESKRIHAAGGSVEFGRVNGNLAVSRSLGDYQYKDREDLPDIDQKVSASADMEIIPRSGLDEFIILGCDGIWDVMTNEQAVSYVTDHLKVGGKNVQDIANNLLTHCLAKGSKDNMSVIIILFPNAPKAIPGFTISDSVRSDVDEDHKKRAEAAKNAENIHLQLAGILKADPSAGGTPGDQN